MLERENTGEDDGLTVAGGIRGWRGQLDLVRRPHQFEVFFHNVRFRG